MPIIRGSSSSLELSNNDYGTGIDSAFSLGLSYDYSLSQGFQVGTDLSVSITDLSNVYSILPGVTYNIFVDNQESLNSAYFIKLNTGVVIVDFKSAIFYSGRSAFSPSTSEFVYTLRLGKRFLLAENISWSPSIQMTHAPDAFDSDPSVTIQLFKIDVTF
jgi:hypothetical protein